MASTERKRPLVATTSTNPDGTTSTKMQAWSEAFAHLPDSAQFALEHQYLHNNVINLESDRAAGVLSVAYLDNLLDEILKRFLRESSQTNGLLKMNVSKRLDLVYALGFLSLAAYTDLKTMFEIRNVFAHDWAIHTFADPKIVAMCKKLSATTLWKDWDFADPQTPRHVFAISTLMLVGEISNGVRYAKPRIQVPPIATPNDQWKGY